MIQLQIIGKDGTQLQPLIRAALKSKKLRTFTAKRVRGGLRIEHTTFIGSISFLQRKNILLATVTSGNSQYEWRILGAFIERLTDHFRDRIAAINMQF